MNPVPRIDPDRVARWRQIDAERAERLARSLAERPPPPPEVVVLPPKRERADAYDPRRYGRAADGVSPGGGYRVLRGPRSSG